MSQSLRTAPSVVIAILSGSHTEIVANATSADGRGHNARPFVTLLLLGFLAFMAIGGRAVAHEIPTDVVVQSYLKPEAGTVNLLLRVPLEAMRDVDIPLRGPGYIDVERAEPFLRDAGEIWLANFIRIYADGELLEDWRIDAARLSLPSDRSFRNYDDAYTHILFGPLDPTTDLYRDQALLDVLITYPVSAGAEEFAVEPDFGRLGLRTTTVLNFLPGGDVRRVFEFSGSPGLVPLDSNTRRTSPPGRKLSTVVVRNPSRPNSGSTANSSAPAGSA